MEKESKYGLAILLSITAIILIPLIFVLGLATGSQIQHASLLSADSLSSWLAAISTFVIAVLTCVLARETWILRKAQIEQVNQLRVDSIRPRVGIEVDSSPAAYSLAEVRIKNYGKGIAKNIRFNFTDRSGNLIQSGDDEVVDYFYKLHIFRDQITSLGILQNFKSYVFNYNDLSDEANNTFFIIEILYEDIEGNQYEDSHVIDFKENDGVSAIGGVDPLYKIANNIEKLQEKINTLTKPPFNRIPIDIYNAQDRETDKAIRAHQRRLFQARQRRKTKT